MDSVSLSDLAPIIAAILGPMLAFVVVSMRHQHQDSTKTRELIEQSSRENRELIEQSSRENRELIEQSSRENRELIEQSRRENQQSHREVTRSLADARARLARIEGHLSIAAPPPLRESAGEDAGTA